MSDAIRVLIVDDHLLLRDGIAVLIANCTDIVVVGQAESGQDAIDAYRKLRPDVTLMDLQLPDMDGADAIKAIISEAPHARIIVLTTYSGDARAQKALRRAHAHTPSRTTRDETCWRRSGGSSQVISTSTPRLPGRSPSIPAKRV